MAKVKEVLECEFMGPAGDYMALQAVFPGAKDPTAPAPRDKYMKKKKVVEGKALKMHAERIKEGEFALQTGVPQLAVEFIGANARELTAEAIAGYLNPPQSATENVVGSPGADEPTRRRRPPTDETMDEEEYAEFIAADPVQGAVDLPNPRPPLLLADLFAAEAARKEPAKTTQLASTQLASTTTTRFRTTLRSLPPRRRRSRRRVATPRTWAVVR